jgi:hypothetical protein
MKEGRLLKQLLDLGFSFIGMKPIARALSRVVTGLGSGCRSLVQRLAGPRRIVARIGGGGGKCWCSRIRVKQADQRGLIRDALLKAVGHPGLAGDVVKPAARAHGAPR